MTGSVVVDEGLLHRIFSALPPKILVLRKMRVIRFPDNSFAGISQGQNDYLVTIWSIVEAFYCKR